MEFFGKENILDLLYKIINNIIKIIILIYNISSSMTKLNSLNSQESANNKSKTARFIDSTRRAINKALTTTWIVASSFLPTSVNTITTSSALWTTITSTIWVGTAASLLTACSWDSDELDTIAPTVTLKQSEIDITWWKVIRISGNQLLIWDDVVASWTDNASKNCSVKLSFDWNNIISWDTLSKKGTLSITVTDEAGNSKNTSIKLNTINNAPEVSVHKEMVDIAAWKTISIDWNQLTIWDEVVASWEDDNTKECSTSIKFNGEQIKSGTIIKDEWTLSITVTDEEGLSSSINITLFINNWAPEISILQPEVDVSQWKTISKQGNKLLLWTETIASWTDDNTTNCTLSLKFNDEEIKTGTSIRTAGTLEIVITDKDWKSSSVNIKLIVNNAAPTITLKQSKVNIFWGTKVTISNNQLLIWDQVIASRNDDRTKNCKTSLKLNGAEITSGTTINDAGKLELTVTDEDGEISKKEITLTKESIYWLENLRNLSIQVDQEVDIMKGITFADWIQLQQVAIEMDGKTTVLNAPYHFTATTPWTCTIIITMKWPNGQSFQEKVSKTISPLEYKSITINNLKPADILPIVGQIDRWDPKAYEHIEHLRIAEATKIRDMMWQYWAWTHSPEQYQQLMSRLHTGMTAENPKWYSNYEIIWWKLDGQPWNHGYIERNILNTIISHATFQVQDDNHESEFTDLLDMISSNPNNIYILWCSAYSLSKSNNNSTRILDNYKKLYQSPNFIFRVAGANIDTENGIVMNKILQKDASPTDSGEYWRPSLANGKNDATVDRHIMVTIWTNATGNADITGKDWGSKFPIGFHKDVIFAWRTFPRKEPSRWHIQVLSEPYQTSSPNYVNLAMTDLCFQMFAEVKDVDELLNMIRATSLTDHISLDWQTQALHLIDPAWFFQKYDMPTKLPSSIKSWETISLNKWYYKWVIFDIPWAEVKINWKWVAYTDSNKSQIKAQNPMNLEWRLNWDLCKKLWYSSSKPIQWKIIVVDDKWNGLNISKDISIKPN